MLEGLFQPGFAGYLIYALVVTHITIAAVTIYLHRHQAHRALELHPAVSHFFRFWLWLTTGMVTREWVAVHRRHHAACETPGDPHSPQVLGLRKVLLQGAELYRGAATQQPLLEQYGRGTPDDWLERNLYGRHSGAGIGLMLLLNVALFGVVGLTLWAVQMLWIPFWAAGVINGVGHARGYRNYHTPDASTNIVPWGLVIGGEELHNNHHAYPDSARFSARWWEVDIGWFYIRLLQSLKLARVKRVAPRPGRIAGSGTLDGEAAMAIIANRFEVLARYRREVLARVHREEVRQAGDRTFKGLLKQARAALIRDASLLDAEARRRLQAALAGSERLNMAYRHWEQLQQIWQQAASGGPERACRLLQEWCRQAEQSGIRRLEEFAQRLGSYRQQPA